MFVRKLFRILKDIWILISSTTCMTCFMNAVEVIVGFGIGMQSQAALGTHVIPALLANIKP